MACVVVKNGRAGLDWTRHGRRRSISLPNVRKWRSQPLPAPFYSQPSPRTEPCQPRHKHPGLQGGCTPSYLRCFAGKTGNRRTCYVGFVEYTTSPIHRCPLEQFTLSSAWENRRERTEKETEIKRTYSKAKCTKVVASTVTPLEIPPQQQNSPKGIAKSPLRVPPALPSLASIFQTSGGVKFIVHR